MSERTTSHAQRGATETMKRRAGMTKPCVSIGLRPGGFFGFGGIGRCRLCVSCFVWLLVLACTQFGVARGEFEALSLPSGTAARGDDIDSTSQEAEGSFGALRFVAPRQRVYVAHLPKAGGTSLIAEVKRARPYDVAYCECVSAQNKSEGAYVVTQLRIPRQHVVSQFTHCVEAPKSAPLHTRLAAARNQEHSGHPFPTRIEDWVAHDFSDEPPKVHFESYYGCYQPLNLQGNFLTGNKVPNGTVRETLAISVLWRVDLVSVLELMPQISCVIQYAIHQTISDDDCACAGARRAVAHNTHNVSHVPHETLSDDARQKIDELTSADVPLYLAALARALASIRFVEEATGVQILCDAERAILRETLHIGIPSFATRIKTSPYMTGVRNYLMQGASEAHEYWELDNA